MSRMSKYEGKMISRSVVSIMLGAGLLLTGCSGADTQQQVTSQAVLVDVQEAGKGSLVLSNSFVGTISPEDSVYIIPLAQGTVTETFFEVGDEVEAGDVLFKIDDSAAKLQAKQAQLAYSSAQNAANSALTTQQDSANLQLDSGIAQAEAAYVGAQANWKTASDAYDDLEDQYNAAKKALKNAQAAGADEETIAKLKSAKNQLGDAKNKAEVGLNAAEAAMNAAEEAYNNTKKSKELTQGEALEDTKKQLNTSIQQAKVGVDSAQLALSYYQVTTPISGKVISKSVEVNGMASAASPAYVIAGEDTMVVTFNVSEAVMNTLSKDQKLTVERNGAEYTGVITEIGNSVNAATGLFQVKAAVQANGEQLPSGVSVKITGETYRAENELLIPYDAVYYENDGAYVYVADNGTAVKTYVTTGIFNDEQIQILDGISEGTKVITSWSPRLMNGVEITANEVQEAE